MRRRVGLGAIQQQQLATEKYVEKSNVIIENEFEEMSKQMLIFREKLEDFAIKHRNDIRKNAQFRKQFNEMCVAIGVDPLASGKGFWNVLGIGDFYYELSVQIVEVCLAANHTTGGLMELDELLKKLIKSRGKHLMHLEITKDDIFTAAKKLKIFGNGFILHPIGKEKFIVQSIPGELSLEETRILTMASKRDQGCVTISDMIYKLGWNTFRAKQAIEKIIGEGLCWIDEQDIENSYWFPSLFKKYEI